MPIDKIFTGWEKSKAQSLLTEASIRKRAGDTEGAISLLKEAYTEIAKSGKIWNVTPFLRLPMYLQSLGREDEAWQELNLIISKGYPGQPKDKNTLMIEHSIAYDKMRLFLQRSGKNEKAVKYGILAYVTLAHALYKQERMAEREEYISQNKPETVMQKLLKKAGKEDLLRQVCDIVKAELDYMSDFKVEKLSEKIDKLVTGII